MSEVVDSGPQARPGVGIAAYLVSNLREYGLLFALIAIMAFFQIVTNGTLLKPVNVTNLLLQNSYIVIMALGMLIVIVSGHIDLSVGSVMGFVGALAAVLMVELDQSMAVTIAICVLAGGLIGAAQGYWIAYWKIPSFIVTLAGMLVFRGASLWLLEGQSLGPFPREFQMIANGFVPDLFPAGLSETIAQLLGQVRVNLLALLAGVVAAVRYPLARTEAPGAEPCLRHRQRTDRVLLGPCRDYHRRAGLHPFQAFDFPGFAQCADHHGRVDVALCLSSPNERSRAVGSTRWAGTKRQRNFRV